MTYFRYRDLYPEYDFVFLGDNGQGDLLAAQKMLEEQDLADRHQDSGNAETEGAAGTEILSPEAVVREGTAVQHASGDAGRSPRLLCALIRRVLPDEKSLRLPDK